jgi:hypothetical protein
MNFTTMFSGLALAAVLLAQNLLVVPARAHGIPLNFSHYIVVDHKNGNLEMIYNIFFASDVLKANYERFDTDKNGTVEEVESNNIFEQIKTKMTFRIDDQVVTPRSISKPSTLAQVSDLAYPFFQFFLDFGPISVPDKNSKFTLTNRFRLDIEDYQEVHFEFISVNLTTNNIDYYDDFTINGQIKKRAGEAGANQITGQNPESNSTILSPSQSAGIKKGEEKPTVPDPNLNSARTQKSTSKADQNSIRFSYNWWYIAAAATVLGGYVLYKRITKR